MHSAYSDNGKKIDRFDEKCHKGKLKLSQIFNKNCNSYVLMSDLYRIAKGFCMFLYCIPLVVRVDKVCANVCRTRKMISATSQSIEDYFLIIIIY